MGTAGQAPAPRNLGSQLTCTLSPPQVCGETAQGVRRPSPGKAGSGQPLAGWASAPLDRPQGPGWWLHLENGPGLEAGKAGWLTSVRMVRLPWPGQVFTYRSKRTLGSATSRLGSASTPASSPWRPPNTTRACLAPMGGEPRAAHPGHSESSPPHTVGASLQLCPPPDRPSVLFPLPRPLPLPQAAPT